jgi:hypothetical protein
MCTTDCTPLMQRRSEVQVLQVYTLFSHRHKMVCQGSKGWEKQFSVRVLLCPVPNPQACSWYSDPATSCTIQGPNPGMGKRFFSSPKRAKWPWRQPSFLLSGHPGLSPGVKRLGRKVYHPPPSNVEVKNR